MPRPSAVPEKSTTVRPPLAARALGAALRTADRVSPRLAAAWTERLFLTPRRHPVPARERDWLAGARWGELRLDGRRLPTWSWGEGPPVVLDMATPARISVSGPVCAPASSSTAAAAIPAPTSPPIGSAAANAPAAPLWIAITAPSDAPPVTPSNPGSASGLRR